MRRPGRLILDLIYELAILVELEVWLGVSISVFGFDIICIEGVHLVEMNIWVLGFHCIPAILSSPASIVVANSKDLVACAGTCTVPFVKVLKFVNFSTGLVGDVTAATIMSLHC